MAGDPRIAIYDILDEIEFLAQLARNRSLSDFRLDPLAYRAAAYSIQIISEATRRIPDAWLEQFPDQHWKAIKGIGNKMRHEYYRLDDAILWNVITHDAPKLRPVLELMLKSHEAPET